MQLPLRFTLFCLATLLAPVLRGAAPESAWQMMAKSTASFDTGSRNRAENWRHLAEPAWRLYEANPTDARRWGPWATLLRHSPFFPAGSDEDKLWKERTAKIAADAEVATDTPAELRELVLGMKVFALVLPYTRGKLPPDWMSVLVPPIEKLAAEYPAGSGAFVYFSHLVGAVESQSPKDLPALVLRMRHSPNAKVREAGEKRAKVLKLKEQPLDLRFTALDGRAVDTNQWRGRVVIVDFWATWCVPCIQAMPRLKQLYARYHDRGLEVVNVSVDKADARDALVKLVAKLELPWPQCFDGKGLATEYAVRYGVQPVPHVLLVGPDGMIVAVNPSEASLEAEVKRLLKL
jgi:thiol-disulfide isomerase/thioredoxin